MVKVRTPFSASSPLTARHRMDDRKIGCNKILSKKVVTKYGVTDQTLCCPLCCQVILWNFRTHELRLGVFKNMDSLNTIISGFVFIFLAYVFVV